MNITYNELVTLRDNAQLIPGQQYRITDYITNTIQENTKSAGHQFDIIVTADNENTLNEVARACKTEFDLEKYKDAFSNSWAEHMSYVGIYEYEGKEYHLYESEAQDLQMLMDFNSQNILEGIYLDAAYPYTLYPAYCRQKEESWGEWNIGHDFAENIAFKYNLAEDTYFFSSNLVAWQIWYCLDNDTDRFAWADATNGKGVIYYMKDEFNNECPYDFKNIKFKHPNDTKTYPDYYYTFTIISSGAVNDYSLDGAYCYGNTMCRYVDGEKQMVNENVFINTQKYQCHSNSFGNNCRLNAFGSGCYYNTFGNECYFNSFGNYCPINSFDDYCYYNTFGNECYFNSFGNYCYSNRFGENCRNNSFDDYCYNNSFGYGCWYNTFGEDCRYNNFGNKCYSGSFGNCCYANKFGKNCYYNTFGNECYSNNFGESCDNNSFGNECYSNNFGESCDNNSFGNACYSNNFGNNCHNNSFSNSCYENRFGNGSYGNSFKNNCHDNSFGVGCGYNSFGNSCKFICFGESTDNIKSYYRYITFDNGNSYINLNCTSTTSSSKYFQNVRIGLGVNNTTTYKTITDSNVGQTYETYYKPANSQTITI